MPQDLPPVGGYEPVQYKVSMRISLCVNGVAQSVELTVDSETCLLEASDRHICYLLSPVL